MDGHNKIHEVINYGSVYEALSSEYVSVSDVLQYLLQLHTHCTTRSLIAYRAVCLHDKLQLVNGRPFILQTNVKDYIAIHCLSFLGSNIQGQTTDEILEIRNKRDEVHREMSYINAFSRRIHLLCNSDVPIKIVEDQDLELICGARSLRFSDKLFLSTQNKIGLFMMYDWLDQLIETMYELLDKELLTRCTFLKAVAPLYWNGVGKNLYQALISKTLNVKVPVLPRHTLSHYIELFPGLFDPALLSLSTIIYNLQTKPLIYQAYVLGFPIYEYLPSAEAIAVARGKLDQVGIRQYCAEYKAQLEQWLKSHDPCPYYPVEQFAPVNTADLSHDQISDYLGFDIVRYLDDTHVTYFTRYDAKYIVEHGKNPYTQLQLPASIIAAIKTRVELAALWDLPDTKSMKDALMALTEEQPIMSVPIPVPIGSLNPVPVPVPIGPIRTQRLYPRPSSQLQRIDVQPMRRQMTPIYANMRHVHDEDGDSSEGAEAEVFDGQVEEVVRVRTTPYSHRARAIEATIEDIDIDVESPPQTRNRYID